jgi:RES domain-containing protein
VWRAQVGYTLRRFDEVDVEVPFSRERMKPPPDWLLEGRAPEGRINPQGISFLYVATHMETAIGEVRPFLGALVSVAELRTSRCIRLINCTTDEEKIRDIVYFKEPEGDERTLAVWREMDRAFSQPVAASANRADYAATQYLAELFRHNGFDGLAYRSSFGSGHNIALFDLNAADVAAEPQLVEVTGLSLKYSRR